jgi:hypothetical protein
MERMVSCYTGHEIVLEQYIVCIYLYTVYLTILQVAFTLEVEM